jgi:hypothetical protein
MSLRARIFIILSVLMLLILGISIFLTVSRKDKNGISKTLQTTPPSDGAMEGVNGQPVGQTSIGGQMPAGLPAKTATPLEAQKNGVMQLAKVFIERYGTYSTDNDFQNIKDAQALATKSLWSSISAVMASKSENSDFVGVTTKVISMNLIKWSGISATVELKTTRVEEKNGAVSTRYQNVTVNMVKENGLWLADKLVWN